MTAERGIASSAAHAGSEWVESAVHYVAWFWKSGSGKALARKGGGGVTIETIRTWAAFKGLPEAAELRAWGHVTRAAIRQGIIEPTGGYASARSSNGAMKRLYRRGGA